ncbi:hypothetical protein H9P43_007751 [Blastocladiella emersonii ATCC 22665]|nr:hypothetical protein H9P43_007751 [Blastocladiella emersonii ATCC 22665]
MSASDALPETEPAALTEPIVAQLEALYTDPRVVARYEARFRAHAASHALKHSAKLHAADETPDTVKQVLRGLAAVTTANGKPLAAVAQLYEVEPDYYEWSLARRMCRLAAPTRNHLCKTIVMENTRCPHKSIDDPRFSRYYAVIVQYTGKLNTQKLFNFARDLKDRTISKKNYNFRLVDPAVSEELTGYGNNGVSPFGMNSNIPIILAKSITELSPAIFWLGAGHVDWKVAVPTTEFIEATGCFVADLE